MRKSFSIFVSRLVFATHVTPSLKQCGRKKKNDGIFRRYFGSFFLLLTPRYVTYCFNPVSYGVRRFANIFPAVSNRRRLNSSRATPPHDTNRNPVHFFQFPCACFAAYPRTVYVLRYPTPFLLNLLNDAGNKINYTAGGHTRFLSIIGFSKISFRFRNLRNITCMFCILSFESSQRVLDFARRNGFSVRF